MRTGDIMFYSDVPSHQLEFVRAQRHFGVTSHLSLVGIKRERRLTVREMGKTGAVGVQCCLCF